MNIMGERPEVNLDDGLIAWKRVAEPQSDQYDSTITLEFARRRGYLRADIGGAPTFFDGKIGLRGDDWISFGPDCVPAPKDHPNLERASELIRLWPIVFTQCQLLIDSVTPFFDVQNPEDRTLGSTCGPGGSGFGAIASTVNNHVGFAEALLHEMAHHKLRALGVEFESADRIITNPSEQRFKSPIRYDCLRPMPAVLHAQYSYTYVSALDIEIIKTARNLEKDRRIAEESLAVILPKLEFGLKVIQENAQLDSTGADFLVGLFAWTGRILEDGYRILDRFQITPKTFSHPLESRANGPQQEQLMAAKHPFRRRGVSEYPLGDEMLLYTADSETAFSLSSSAKAIWELCDGRQTVLKIIQELGGRYGCPGDKLLSDVIAAIAELRNVGLLELAETPHSNDL